MGDGVAATDHHEFHLRAKGRSIDEFFGAPVGMMFTLEEDLEIGSWLDLGIFIGALALAARGELPEPRRGRLSRRVRSFPVTPRVTLAPDERAQRWLPICRAKTRRLCSRSWKLWRRPCCAPWRWRPPSVRRARREGARSARSALSAFHIGGRSTFGYRRPAAHPPARLSPPFCALIEGFMIPR